MKGIIIMGTGRSQSKAMEAILRDNQYKGVLEKLSASGISIEDMQYFAQKVSASFSDATEAYEKISKISELLNLRGKELNESLHKVKVFERKHPNPFYRQYRRK